MYNYLTNFSFSIYFKKTTFKEYILSHIAMSWKWINIYLNVKRGHINLSSNSSYFLPHKNEAIVISAHNECTFLFLNVINVTSFFIQILFVVYFCVNSLIRITWEHQLREKVVLLAFFVSLKPGHHPRLMMGI